MSTRSRLLVLLAVLLLGGAAVARAVRQHRVTSALLRADPDRIAADPALGPIALARGAGVFAQECAACHGAAGKGDPSGGVPDLTDHDHLYGSGLTGEIEQIVLHGIRSRDSKGWNLASMPAYATAHPYAREAIQPLTPQGAADLVQYILSRGGRPSDPAATARGKLLYAGSGGCWDCHSPDAEGDSAIGAPNLTDTIWLYGGSPDAIYRSITEGRRGVCPGFARRLDPAAVRAVAVYVAALPGRRPS